MPTRPNFKYALLLWLTGALCLAVVAIVRWPGDDWLAVDFQALLPSDTANPWVTVANKQTADTYEKQIVWLIEGESAEAVGQFALQVKQQLKQAGYADSQFETEQFSQWQKLTEALLQHHRGLIAPTDYPLVQANPEAYFEQFRRLLYSPLGGMSFSMLERDPSGLFASYMGSATPKKPAWQGIDSGVLSELLVTNVPHDKQNFGTLPELYTVYQALKQQASQQSLTLLATGAPLYTAYGVKSAQREMSTIGVASLTLLSALLLFSLRSVTAVMLTLGCIATGVVGGLLITVSVLQQIHILMLVFGASLIGIAADYALHYLAHSRNSDWTQATGMAKVNDALRLSVLSSAGAFSTLLLLPFPGIRQIGLFMASGLICSYLTVYLLFPVFYKGLKKPAPLAKFWQRRQWQWGPAPVLLSLLSLTALLLVFQFESSDDVREFYAAPDQLTSDQEKISAALESTPDSRFLLVEAATVEELLVLEHQVVKGLQRLQNDFALAGFQGISDLIPLPATQMQSNAVFSNPDFSAALERHMQILGLSEEVRVRGRAAFEASFKPLDISHLEKIAMPAGVGGFLGCKTDSCASRIKLDSVKDFSAVAALVDQFERVTLVDQVTSINKTMGAYRSAVSYLLLAAVVLVAVFMTLFYGWRMAAGIVITPLATCLLSLLVVSYIQGSYSLINLMALLLLIGVSLDYSIFRAFTPTDEQAATALAISLSAATSILAFGLLGLSDTPVIRSFGQTIAIGLIFAWVFSWLQLVDRSKR
jgi:predicted exporter